MRIAAYSIRGEDDAGFKMKKAISYSIVVSGFTAMASQIILMRELLIVFFGNELSIGFILASWLIGGAIGSLLLGRLADRIHQRAGVFSLCQLALSILLPLSILAIRSIRAVLAINTGEVIPFFPMAASSLIILAPICIILGFLFALACRLYESEASSGAVKIGRVYVLEAVGSMAGGLAASILFIPFLTSLQIMSILGILNILTASTLALSSAEKGSRLALTAAGAVILIATVSMWLGNGWAHIDEYFI